MVVGWTCEVCLVPNDESVNICCCCSSVRTMDIKREISRDVMELPLKKQKVESYGDDVDRIRMDYVMDDLKSTVVFVVGSSEIEQIPQDCCDKKRIEGGLESLYECSLPTPILNMPKIKVINVSCGALHTALLTSNGNVYTFGCNDMGALGRLTNNSNVPDSEPFIVELKQPIKKVTCGDNHTLFLTYNGNVYLCGGFKDSEGLIGMVDYNEYTKLKYIDFVNIPIIVPCDIEGSTIITDISSGENHCVLLPNGGGGVYVFGSNEFNQLMIWNDDQIQVYTEDDIDLKDSKLKKLSLVWPQYRTVFDLNVIDGLDDELPGKRKRRRRSIDSIIGIYTGYCTTFIQTKNSLKVYGAGRNGQGEVGCNSNDKIVSKPTELKVFQGLEIHNLIGGQFFTMALLDDGLYTWGSLDYNGHNNNIDRQPIPLKLDAFNDVPIEFIFNGADTSFAVTLHNEIYAWGSAQNYILGNGKDYVLQKSPVLIPNEHLLNFKIINGMGGSQHTVFLCNKRRNNRTFTEHYQPL